MISDFLKKKGLITTNKTAHEAAQTEQYRQNSSLPEASMTTSVKTSVIHNS